MGHFLLTGLLLDHLKKTPESRVVNVSSLGHKKMRKHKIEMNFDDLMFEKAYDPAKVYG